MHADSLFPCTMKSGMECDSKGFSAGRSIRLLAIKTRWKERKMSTDYVCKPLCHDKNILKATQDLQDEFNLLIK